jgi:hypothetical protein
MRLARPLANHLCFVTKSALQQKLFYQFDLARGSFSKVPLADLRAPTETHFALPTANSCHARVLRVFKSEDSLPELYLHSLPDTATLGLSDASFVTCHSMLYRAGGTHLVDLASRQFCRFNLYKSNVDAKVNDHFVAQAVPENLADIPKPAVGGSSLLLHLASKNQTADRLFYVEESGYASFFNLKTMTWDCPFKLSEDHFARACAATHYSYPQDIYLLYLRKSDNHFVTLRFCTHSGGRYVRNETPNDISSSTSPNLFMASLPSGLYCARSWEEATFVFKLAHDDRWELVAKMELGEPIISLLIAPQ